MTQKTASDIPNAAWILALVGGILIVLSGALLLGVGAFVLPHVDYANVAVPTGFDAAGIPALVSGMVGTMGAIGLVSGAIVMVAAVMLLRGTSSWRAWSALILAFSILSFVGLGGFVLGAVLGMIGGILALRYRPSVQSI
jgi:hypothetical protein